MDILHVFTELTLYEKLSIFTQIFAASATFLAVLVSLRIANRRNKVKFAMYYKINKNINNETLQLFFINKNKENDLYLKDAEIKIDDKTIYIVKEITVDGRKTEGDGIFISIFGIKRRASFPIAEIFRYGQSSINNSKVYSDIHKLEYKTGHLIIHDHLNKSFKIKISEEDLRFIKNIYDQSSETKTY